MSEESSFHFKKDETKRERRWIIYEKIGKGKFGTYIGWRQVDGWMERGVEAEMGGWREGWRWRGVRGRVVGFLFFLIPFFYSYCALSNGLFSFFLLFYLSFFLRFRLRIKKKECDKY